MSASQVDHENGRKRGFQLSGAQASALFVAMALLPLVAPALSRLEPVGGWSEFSSGLALIAAALVFLQFLTSGRFECLSGRIGIDRVMGFHRPSAVVLVLFAAMHPLGYVSTALIEVCHVTCVVSAIAALMTERADFDRISP